MPRDEVESCCHAPPAYEPRRIPAAVGLDIPVPPPPAPRRPARVLPNVMVLPEAVIVVLAVSPLNAVDDVASVTAGPVWRAPTGPIEVSAAVKYVAVSTESVPSPLMVLTNPFEVRLERREMFCVVFTVNDVPEYERPVPAVVVATHVGTPETSASTWPLVPAVVVASLLVPFPRRSVFAWRFAHPVPPFAAPRIEVPTWVAKSRAPLMVARVEVAALYTLPSASSAKPPKLLLVRLREPKNALVEDA